MKPRRIRQAGWRTRLRRLLPSAESVRSNRWVGWIGPALHHPRLWHLNRRGVALGMAIGVFFAFLTPVAQIPLAAVAAVWLRGNIVAAVVSTLVTNPFTFAPIYLLAYRLGAFIIGHGDVPVDSTLVQVAEHASSIMVTWSDKFVAVGKQLIVGLSLMAVVGAFCAYFGVLGAWRLFVVVEWRRRNRRHHQT
jgi:uncharacterized protein (DUF2062 family)